MFVAEMRFPFTGSQHEEAVDAVQSLLAAMYKNGQIAVDLWPMSMDDGLIRAVLLIPDNEALDRQFANEYVLKELTSLDQSGVGEPVVGGSNFDPGSLKTCDCTESSSYILYTNYLTYEPPVRCGQCFRPVPLYRLPTGNRGEHLDILTWRGDYKSCDTLQMHCTVGERFAEQQLCRHDSALSRFGREVCRDITARTGVPMYYFLFKSRGRTVADERDRKCPECAGEWLLVQSWHGMFEFKCDRCFLLSNIACSLQR